MSYKQPTSYEEYIVNFEANGKVSGRGLTTTQHFPCPFCAAPNCVVAPIISVQEHLRRGGTCKECGRGWRTEFTGKAPSISFEMVQTSGPDQPEWLQPKMRRVGK